ncbi:hypothetical protein A3D71_02290 [Candidatus Kaiserbacteria bacterium RIFCSPHIGHO2_02_FULL_55_20]|uniref:Uncharacterized protein n=1 Tax=Candidatus Kaiserbacteria bacterium RIFCSPHIGHO2_02_FULL_55_20 TaxID=1798497 RepID=A0A1F6DWH0_9BACT|nr:MAG: hypothetical protein A2680_00565 [Candidatus Kaiserbacteria bacterium RIFCSPHIGHO2_01_FULL_55_37]OGG65753.1 MAG: hypothetical protein A3D71_02290 [Candidatus Kaiserbacteria bacterium RIFCSPHIGHO2_02_FULL_55_20]
MRTSLLILVPGVLLTGLLFGAYRLNSLSPAETPCVLGACPLSLHESDSGKTFAYNVGARFGIFLDENNNPKTGLRCAPEGVIELRQYTDSEPPAYVASFEAKTPGTCMLTDKDFSATIVVK